MRVSLLIDDPESLTPIFMQQLRTCISVLMETPVITSFTLEWNGNHLLELFDSQILPLYEDIRSLCQEKNIDFHYTLNIAFSSNPVIHNKLFHKKGLPTFEKYLSLINTIKTDFPDILLNLHVFYKNKKELAAFKRQLKNSRDKNKINFSGKKIKTLKPKPNFILFVNDKLLYCARKNMLLMNDTGNIFSTYVSYKDKSPVGKMTSEGSIEWNILKREQDLVRPWFMNKECKNCKLLPFLKQTCCEYQITENSIFCPVKSKVVSEEKIIRSIIRLDKR